MLKPNELRIGNWVETTTGIRQVFEVSEEVLNGFKSTLRNAQPIALTQEILRICGFKEKGGIMIVNCNNSDFCISDYDQSHKKVWKNERYLGILPLQYLHQLQNLYYVLTGEELPVNLYSTTSLQ
jgi:hypothetical protein